MLRNFQILFLPLFILFSFVLQNSDSALRSFVPLDKGSKPYEVKSTSKKTAFLNQAFTLKMGQVAEVEKAKFSLNPEKIVEDSRCPVSSSDQENTPSTIHCIWAGQVVLNLSIQDVNNHTETFQISTTQPLIYRNLKIEIINITPLKVAERDILENEYVFQFKVSEAHESDSASKPATQVKWS